MNDLTTLRLEIDRIDDALAQLLSDRFAIVDQIKAIKQTAGQITYQPAREAQILHRLKIQYPNLSLIFLKSVWRIILNEAVAAQGKLKIAVTSHLYYIARSYFGSNAELEQFDDNAALFSVVENRNYDIGLIAMPASPDEWENFIKFNYVKVIEKIGDDLLILSGNLAMESGNDRTIVATRHAASVPQGVEPIGKTKRASVFDCAGYLEHEYFLNQAADETLIIGHYPVI